MGSALLKTGETLLKREKNANTFKRGLNQRGWLIKRSRKNPRRPKV